MADDSGYVSKQLNSIDYSQAIAVPAMAICNAECKLAYANADFIKTVGFDADGKLINSKFTHTKTRSDGTQITESFELPYIALVRPPSLQTKRANVTLDLEISQSSETKENLEAGGEAEAKLGWGPFSLSIKAKASYSKEQTRKTDTRAKHHIEVEYEQAPLPEGISLLLETLRNTAFDNNNLVPALDAPKINVPIQ